MKQKPKILLIASLYPESADDSVLDATRALHNFVTSWSTSAEVMVIRPKPQPRYRIVLRPFSLKNLFHRSVEHVIDGIEVHTLSYITMPRLHLFNHEGFSELLVREGFIPDIILTHRSQYFSIGDRLSEIYSVPHIVGLHSSCLHSIKLYKKILSRSDSIACRSYSIKRRFLEELPEFGDKAFIANSGIEKDKILKEMDFITKSVAIKSNVIKIISVCGLIPRKNIDRVISALSGLPSHIEWYYTIIGEGPEKERLERLAHSLTIDDKVSFTGYIENSRVYEFLDESNVFAMVSSLETFGLSYLEAMARGNIVIGTKGWGVDGIVIDGVNGYLCDEASVDNVRTKIMEIITMSSTERRSMQDNIFETIKDYTNEKMSQVYFEVIEKCIQKN